METLTVNDELIDTLKETCIYQQRSGFHGKPEAYQQRVKNGLNLIIAKNTCIEAYSTIADGLSLFSLGSFSSIASTLHESSKVGRYSQIAEDVKSLGFRHPIEAVSMSSAFFNFGREFTYSYFLHYQQAERKDIELKKVPTPQPHVTGTRIGSDVWIGSDVYLKGGITIGDGAVIAQGSVVVKDVPAYSIVGGNPAKVIKKRFPDEIISGLKESQWWNYELGDMFSEKLDFSDPEKFLSKFANVKRELSLYKPKLFLPYMFKTQGKGVVEYGKYLLSNHGHIMVFDSNDKRIKFIRWENRIPEMTSVYYDDAGKLWTTSGIEIHSISVDGSINSGMSSAESIIKTNFHNGQISIQVGDEYLSDNGDSIKFSESAQDWELFSVIN